MLRIRTTTDSDLQNILMVEQKAFGEKQGAEIVQLVDDLLKDPTAMPLLSLIAEEDGKSIGHILFTQTQIEGSKIPVSSAILAPLAVVPEAQAHGVGGQLIKEGLRQLKDAHVDLIFVLGHPGYYPRHGFKPKAGALGFEATYPIPEKDADAWMVKELRPGIIGSVQGKVICCDALNKPQYWVE